MDNKLWVVFDLSWLRDGILSGYRGFEIFNFGLEVHELKYSKTTKEILAELNLLIMSDLPMTPDKTNSLKLTGSLSPFLCYSICDNF